MDKVLYADPVLDNIAAGYRLAWVHRWKLLPALLPVLIPLLMVLLAMDLLATGHDTSIIDGTINLSRPVDAASWAASALTIVCWLLALTAGVVVMVAAQRTKTVRPTRALLVSASRLPFLLAGLIVFVIAATAVTWVGGVVASALGSPFGAVALLALLVTLALFAARLAFAVATSVFGGSILELTRGRVWRTAGAILIGGAVVPLGLAWLRSYVSVPVVTDVLDALLVVGTVAAQAAMLACVYVSSVEAAELDARLGRWQGETRPRRLVAAAVVLPALFMAAVVATNPYELTSVDANRGGPSGGPMAVAWPAGQHPIIVSNAGVRFCEDDLCEHFVGRTGGPPVMQGFGVVGIGPTGIVVKASLTGGQENGGPFIHYGQCTKEGGCDQAWLPARASSDEPFAWPEMAVSSAPDGSLLFALAVPPPPIEQAEPGTVEFKLIRCPDMKCAKPERHSLGTIKGVLDEGHDESPRGKLVVQSDGRPVASFWIGHAIQTFTCDPVSCANPRIANASAGPATAPWLSVGAQAAWVSIGTLSVGDRTTRLAGANLDDRSAALAMSGNAFYVAMAVKSPPSNGFRIWIGKQPEDWQYVLWRCPDAACANPRRVPLDVVQGPPGPVMLAVSQDGRVLVVREDRTLLI